jgi:CRISPR-associated endonuclease/helicase Cas3
LVACHDIGKAHPYFQLRSEVLSELPVEVAMALGAACDYPSFRHEKYSYMVLNRIWRKQEIEDDIGEDFAEILIDNIGCVLADHHQKIGKSINIPGKYRKEYEEMQDVLESELSTAFHPEFFKQCSDWSAFCEGLNGIVILSDWIASNPSFNPNENYGEVDAIKYLEKAYSSAEKTIKSIGFKNFELPSSKDIVDFYGWDLNTLRPMQSLINNEITKVNPIFTIIEDIPGSGKTEAALYLALSISKYFGKEGLYFALPTAATSNQMWERLNHIFERYHIPNFKLVHGTSWSVINSSDIPAKNKYGSEDGISEDWLRPSRRALLSQCAVGTVDQIMMAVLKVKFRQLRMLGLTNKVIIIDEVHAYDTYMSTIIKELLEWCRAMNIPVILLSATLPLSKKAEYISAYTGEDVNFSKPKDYPLITSVTPEKQMLEVNCLPYKTQTYEICMLPYLNEIEKTADKALDLVQDGGNLCLLVNTVSDAQKIYATLMKKIKGSSDVQIILYHARFKIEDRNRIERECLDRYSASGKRPYRSIAVCTQVVEQSLDVDFDILMTQICPIDLLIQRCGREWRHDIQRPVSIKKPQVFILDGDYQKSAMKEIYDADILDRTREYLSNKNTLDIPGDLREAIEYAYNDSKSLDIDSISYRNKESSKTQAKGGMISWPDPTEYFLVETEPDMVISDDETNTLRVATRIGTPSTRIALCNEDLFFQYKGKQTDIKIQNEILSNSVSIPIGLDFKKCEQTGVLKGIYLSASRTNIYRITENIQIEYDSEYGAKIIYKN